MHATQKLWQHERSLRKKGKNVTPLFGWPPGAPPGSFEGVGKRARHSKGKKTTSEMGKTKAEKTGDSKRPKKIDLRRMSMNASQSLIWTWEPSV
jgi:hypothetical protein